MQNSIKLTFDVPLEKAAEIAKAVMAIMKPDNEYAAIDTTEEWPEIFCPNDVLCGWSGNIADLRINNTWQVACPRCKTIVSRKDYGLDIHKWSKLSIANQTKFTLVTPDGDEFDIDVVWATQFGSPICEVCSTTKVGVALYGTSDSREPKWCLQHYKAVNRNGRFVTKRKGV